MKLPAIAVATFAVTALVGGTAAAQVTMQPIPNPPETAKMAHKGGKHHHGKHHMPKHHHAKAEAAKADKK